MTQPPILRFTYRSARSGILLVGLGSVIVIETVGLHLWLVQNHPLIAWSLTVSSVCLLAWLASDYRSFGNGAIDVSDASIDIRVGSRLRVMIARAQVAGVSHAHWQDIPQRGTRAASDFVEPMRPADPNVLLALTEPATVRLGVLKRDISRIALCVDDPDGFIAAIGVGLPRRGSMRPPRAPNPGEAELRD
jgi:hypothetical protein